MTVNTNIASISLIGCSLFIIKFIVVRIIRKRQLYNLRHTSQSSPILAGRRSFLSSTLTESAVTSSADQPSISLEAIGEQLHDQPPQPQAIVEEAAEVRTGPAFSTRSRIH